MGQFDPECISKNIKIDRFKKSLQFMIYVWVSSALKEKKTFSIMNIFG